ncbi:hypothetical protein [Pseudophaeobacter sp. EL27]|uniref:hypothetical protein n=1 Tax=Pseudophaeobacter sp. EL27 TaxID=2107580 RepID=UPI000EFD4C36|nr:hypothetical protein [Pseudophaeobacter sp. EL27]
MHNQQFGIAERLPEADLYFFATTTEKRVQALESLLKRAYRHLVDGRKDYAGLGEDGLTNIICGILSTLGIVANHDVKRGGHVDLTVEDHSTGFLWVAEAKIHRGASWTDAGFLQLSTRYGRSMSERDHAEILIYHTEGQKPSAAVLTDWMHHIKANHQYVDIVEDEINPHLFFRTEHDCKGSGLPYHVRHTIVPMTHDPLK